MSKLVRDKIPEILKEKGFAVNTRVLTDDQEYLLALRDKLLEEVNELVEVLPTNNEAHIQEEIADVLEVIYSICKHKNCDLQSIEKIRQAKQTKRGGFDKRILSIY